MGLQQQKSGKQSRGFRHKCHLVYVFESTVYEFHIVCFQTLATGALMTSRFIPMSSPNMVSMFIREAKCLTVLQSSTLRPPVFIPATLSRDTSS